MQRRFGALAVVMSLSAARCSSCKSSAPADGGAPVASVSATPRATPAALSLPMAADHDAAGGVWVAGFVAAKGTVNVSHFDPQGRLLANVDALTGLKFSSDAHVDLLAGTHGALVVWRGIREGKRTRVAQWVGENVAPAGAPFAIGSSGCVASDTLFTIGGKGGSSLLARHVPDGADKSLVTLPDGHDPSLVCGEDKRAFVVDEGEDDIGVRALASDKDKAGHRAVLVSPDDLGDDEVREHEDFTTGDTLRELLLTEKGHLALRQYDDAVGSAEGGTTQSATLGPRRALDTVVGSDEDLMAVDGNASHVVAVIAREAGSRCDGDLGTDVLALDVPMDGSKEQLVPVAQGACGRDLGPYWVAPTPDAIYVAWSIRGPRNGNRAPVEALAWAKLGAPATEVKLSAEDVVFAGCAKGKCMFAALARPEGTDGMVPGEARVISIP